MPLARRFAQRQNRKNAPSRGREKRHPAGRCSVVRPIDPSMPKRYQRKLAANPGSKAQLVLPLIFFGLAGLVFCMLGGVYATGLAEDLQEDRFGFALGTSRGTVWHRSFDTAEHPLLYAVRLLIDATGALGGAGVGLFFFGFLIWVCTKDPGPLLKKMEKVGMPWITASAIIFGAHFALGLVSYALAFIDRV